MRGAYDGGARVMMGGSSPLWATHWRTVRLRAERRKFSQEIQGADLADAGHAQQQREAQTQFGVLREEGHRSAAHLFDATLQIAQ